jgi:hypothetical protein
MSELTHVRTATFNVTSAKERLDDAYKELAEACEYARNSGYTLEQVAEACERTRERVRQIIHSKGKMHL